MSDSRAVPCGHGEHGRPRDEDELIARARRVLDGNWTGSSTVPSRSLYPHQWSWDTAFIAIGRARVEQERAQRELEELFTGQWASGMVPHIVFNPAVPPGAYFPGPKFWQSDRARGHPKGVATSGITQPPLHPVAALHVHRHAGDEAAALAFLRRLYPKLVAQEHYLARHRDPAGRGLASIIHPWESGTDNSPLWDHALHDVTIPAGALPHYQRVDTKHADPADRPSDAAYDRFVYLAITHRDAGYDDDHLLATSPFLVEDPLFNAVWCWSEHALAQIATLVGADPEPHRRTAARIHQGLLEHLWDGRTARFQAYDLRARRRVGSETIASLVPVLDPDLPEEQLGAIIRLLDSGSFHPTTEEEREHFLLPTYDLRGPDFSRRRYWRGPVWINTDWLIWRGLCQHGVPPVTAELYASVPGLIRRSGFREYFDPFDGAGYGSDDFSWTAALLIDVLHAAPTG